MQRDERRGSPLRSLPAFLLALALAGAIVSLGSATLLPGGGPDQSDCYVELRTQGSKAGTAPNRLECTDGDPECDQDGDCHNKSCRFRVQVCINQAGTGCAAPSGLKKLQISPRKLNIPAPTTLSGAVCGALTDVVVPLKGKRRNKPGRQVIVLKAKPESAKNRDMDKDKLFCLPRSDSEPCPTTTTSTAPSTTSTSASTSSTTSTTATVTTTTTSTSVTVTTISGSCFPIILGQPIANTYRLQGTTGEQRCTTNAAANRFGTCVTVADCGNTAGACLQLPWVTADGQVMPFPTATQTTFTVAAEGAFPTCEHSVCIPCGNPNAPCAGIPGCEVSGNPAGCVPRGTQGCCDQPGFIVPTFFVNILGGLCSRVDQIGCGEGVVNTSNPQTGDNDVKKEADTSDPGPDCQYGTGDDPPTLPCTLAGAGNDYAGKIVRTIGDGAADANGIHFRLITPELSTTWQDNQSPPGTCADGSTFDYDPSDPMNQELLVSQIVIKAEPTSAGASGAFTDLNGDSCKRAGAGFISNADPDTDGPITVPGAPAGPARPQSYDGTQGAVTAAVSEVFSGPNSPIRDIGFVAITPNMPVVVVPAVSCSCTVTPGCPE